MLQKLGDHIIACLERADGCKASAAETSNAIIRAQLLNLEAHNGGTWQRATNLLQAWSVS
jgi:hypothetical protein